MSSIAPGTSVATSAQGGVAQAPSFEVYVPAPNGVASLDATGNVPSGQLANTEDVSLLGSRLWAFGHSYLQGGGVTHVDRQFITLLAGMLRSDLRDLGVGASLAANDQQFLGLTGGQGGWAWLLQNVVPFSIGAPYTPGANYLPLFCTGINDVINHANDGSGSPITIFKEAMRTHLSRVCTARLFEDTDASIAYGGITWQAWKLDTNKNSGPTYRPIPGNNATWTITLPADFEGGSIAVGLTVWPTSDGQVAFTGTASHQPATKTLSGLAYAANDAGNGRNSSNGVVCRASGLTAADAGKTIIATYSGGAGTTFSTPAAPSTPTVVGTAGSTTYTYERVYRTYNGDTIPSATVSTATGPASLTVSNYVSIAGASSWPSGVEAELIVRTVGGTPGVVAILTAPNGTALDQANVAPLGAYTANTANPLTGGGAVDYWQIESNTPATKVALCNIATPPAATLTSLGITAAQITSYNAALTALAAEFTDATNQVQIIDINAALAGSTALFMPTGNPHPNNRGHAVVAVKAKDVIRPWAVGFPESDQAHQSRVMRRIVGRTISRSPLTGVANQGVTVWGTAGAYSITTSWADVDAVNLQLAIDAQVGDDIEVEVDGMWAATASATGSLDAATVTSGGATLNFFTTGSSALPAVGNPGWFGNSGVLAAISGSVFYTVQAGDIQTLNTVPGVVIIRLKAVSNVNGKGLYCGQAGIPITMQVRNLGPRNTPGFNAS